MFGDTEEALKRPEPGRYLGPRTLNSHLCAPKPSSINPLRPKPKRSSPQTHKSPKLSLKPIGSHPLPSFTFQYTPISLLQIGILSILTINTEAWYKALSDHQSVPAYSARGHKAPALARGPPWPTRSKPPTGLAVTYLWLVGNGGMGYKCNYYYYHSSIPY